jgi:hypothetical protein
MRKLLLEIIDRANEEVVEFNDGMTQYLIDKHGEDVAVNIIMVASIFNAFVDTLNLEQYRNLKEIIK